METGDAQSPREGGDKKVADFERITTVEKASRVLEEDGTMAHHASFVPCRL
jgi:hypothetical protein